MILSSTFPVGGRVCQMNIDTNMMVNDVVWTPDRPDKLSTEDMAEYRKGRVALMKNVGKLLGGPVLVVEM